MLSKEDREKIISDVSEAKREDKIIFLTSEGPCEAKIEDFIKQPAEGILYDLNRDLATLYTLFKESGDIRYINDIALVNVFTYIMNKK